MIRPIRQIRPISPIFFGVLAFSLALSSAFSQPTPVPTNTSVTANKTTGVVTGPVSLSAFKTANDIADGSETTAAIASAITAFAAAPTFNGTLNGTPTSGTLNLSNLTLTLPVLSSNFHYATTETSISLGAAEESDKYPTLELRSSTDSAGVSPLIRGYASRGNIASPTATQSGDYLLALSAKGYGATEYSQHSNGSIELSAFANFTDSSKPVQFQLRLAPTGAIIKKEIVRIRPDGALWLFGGGTEVSAAPAMLNGAVPSFLVTKQAGYLDAGFSVASSTADERGTFLFYKARGTLASPTAIQSGDMVGAVVGAGFDGASNMTGAGVFFVADGAVSTGVVPQAVSLRTGSSSGTRTEALGLASTGYARFRNRVGIGKAPSYALDIYESADSSVRLRLSNAGLGDTGTDGFEIVVTGSATSGEVNILQRENAPLNFWTNATKQAILGATGDFSTTGKLSTATHLEGTEQASAPTAPARDGFRIYAKDNGAGKTVLYVRFASGAAQQIAIEP